MVINIILQLSIKLRFLWSIVMVNIQGLTEKRQLTVLVPVIKLQTLISVLVSARTSGIKIVMRRSVQMVDNALSNIHSPDSGYLSI